MGDLISKKQVLNIINQNDSIAEIERQIMDIPTIVYCKKCKHWGTGVAGETESVKCCEFAQYMVGANGYCVYGELNEKTLISGQQQTDIWEYLVC